LAKSKSIPENFLHVRTYEKLKQYADAFAAGHLSLLGVFGHPGVGKSRFIRRALGDGVCWINGNASAFGIYMLAYEHMDQPIVIDDIDDLYRDRVGIRLLKALCQTEREKTIRWETDSKTLDRRDIERNFTTTSHVVIIGNEWKSLNGNVSALEDRGHRLFFDPSAVEVHRQAAEWFWDQEVFDFIAAHLHLYECPSQRTYYRAWEQKKAGLDWREVVLSGCLKGRTLEVAKLKADPRFASEADRIRAFEEAGHGMRATYFNHARKLQPKQEVPEIKLNHTSPPESLKTTPDFGELLRRRFEQLGNG
jgi:hypothetical protein